MKGCHALPGGDRRLPFQRDDVQGTLAAILTSRPAAPAHAGRLWPVIKGLLEKDPGRRLTAETVLKLLAGVVRQPGPVAARKRRRRAPWSTSVTLVAPPVTVAASTALAPPVHIDTVTALMSPEASRRRRAWIGITAAASAVVVTVVLVLARSGEEPEAAASPAPSGTPSVTPREQYLGTLVGHGDIVLAVAFSPDGALLAAGGTGGEVRLWSTADWRAGTVLARSDALIENLDFSRDGGWLIGGTESELGVPVWQIATGRLVREVEINDEWPMIVRVSPDGASVATGTDHHLVRLRPMTDFTEG